MCGGGPQPPSRAPPQGPLQLPTPATLQDRHAVRTCRLLGVRSFIRKLYSLNRMMALSPMEGSSKLYGSAQQQRQGQRTGRGLTCRAERQTICCRCPCLDPPHCLPLPFQSQARTRPTHPMAQLQTGHAPKTWSMGATNGSRVLKAPGTWQNSTGPQYLSHHDSSCTEVGAHSSAHALSSGASRDKGRHPALRQHACCCWLRSSLAGGAYEIRHGKWVPWA